MVLSSAVVVGLVAFFFGISREKSSESSGQTSVNLSPERQKFLEKVESYLGTLYQWGGGRNPKYDYGVDCSGLVIAALRDAGYALPPCSMPTSDGWWHCLERVDDPMPGDLAFYGSKDQDRAVHVEVVTSWDGHNAEVIGANGGSRSTTTPEQAQEQNAYVRREDSHLHWKKFLGFARNPLELLAQSKPSKTTEGVRLELQHDEVLPYTKCRERLTR